MSENTSKSESTSIEAGTTKQDTPFSVFFFTSQLRVNLVASWSTLHFCVCLSVGLCIPTSHECNIYIVAM